MRKAGPLLATIVVLAWGIGDLERGNRFYREGRYSEAVEAYRAALRGGEASATLHYNLGTALLRLERYDEAERHLRAALGTVEPELRERAHFNLGNRYLEAGRGATDPQARSRLFDAAVEAYKQALRIDPADTDAKWNLELALREKEEQPPTPRSGGSSDQRDRDRQDQQDAQGDGAAGNQSQSPASPSPGGAPPGGEGSGRMTREQAERILSAVEQDERELYRQKLRKGRRNTPVTRDW